ncbi:MAG: succinate dehydrogenase, hydrophobic membrane anchor protein [Phenylobacterium sp.]|uniref:succinate dehydrogenase, hydrophobic membrane anchor protein n=1 Tax=Phenylobacterium sp. TaxID=1871053 RepID=UPI001A52A5E0|nr:succinate dehydrogenase, hydrophobic membrane anchor protein [Phenylobacterium sp.]MBL8554792.1 succinate dehydrogenase, hydrophobic membrane anchor protein [Phenylobacterium sp.]
MSYRTPLSQARGLGSAKHGVGHWLSERVAAIALVPLVLWGAYSVILLAGMDYYEAAAWIGDPLNATLMILTIFVSTSHMISGVRVVIEDYVYSNLNKAAALLLNLFIGWLAGALAIFSVLKVALGGA